MPESKEERTTRYVAYIEAHGASAEESPNGGGALNEINRALIDVSPEVRADAQADMDLFTLSVD